MKAGGTRNMDIDMKQGRYGETMREDRCRDCGAHDVSKSE